MNSTTSLHQRTRLTGPINFGSIFQPPRAPPLSSVLQFQEREIDIFVSINEGRTVQLRINNGMRVGDIIDQIMPNLEEGNERPFLVYQNEVMQYNDFIADWDVLDRTIVRVRGRELVPIRITVKLPEVNQAILEFTDNQTILGYKIKTAIHQEHGLEISFMSIFHAQAEINDQSSLADLGIYADCTITLKYGEPKGVKSKSMLSLKDQSEIRLQSAHAGHEILSFDPNQPKKQQKIQCNQTYQANSFCKITLVNKLEIVCCEGCYFFTSYQRWTPISLNDRDRNRLKIGDRILTVSKDFIAVDNIHHYYQNRQPNTFLYILLDNYHPYFVNKLLFTPSLDVQVLIRRQKYIKFITFHMFPRMTVGDLKGMIYTKIGIDPQEQHLFIQGRQLMLKENTEISEIYTSSLIIQLFPNERDLKSLIRTQKMVAITFHKVTKSINYRVNAQKTCEQVIRRQFPQRIGQIQFIGVLCGSKVIDLSRRLNEIINFEEESFYYSTLQMIVFKFPEKFKLSKIIQQFRPRNRSQLYKKNFFETMCSIFVNRNNVQDPLLAEYKANHMLNEIRDLLKNINRVDLSNNALNPRCRHISEFIHFLDKRPQFIGKCYRALAQAPIFVLNSIISISQFLSCTPKKTKALYLLGQRGTIFEIHSISGKSVNIGNDEEEVVFLPYTYFIVGKATTQNQITTVQLLQMPTSLSFNKPIILWVDDIPKNNITSINQYKKQGTQVIQLSSTVMARRWFQQFGWFINRLNLNLRVISDMVRLQPDRQGLLKKNNHAGADLIQYLFTDRGFTTPVLVYCSDVKRGLENLRTRKINKQRFHKVSNQQAVVKEYMSFRPLASG